MIAMPEKQKQFIALKKKRPVSSQRVNPTSLVSLSSDDVKHNGSAKDNHAGPSQQPESEFCERVKVAQTSPRKDTYPSLPLVHSSSFRIAPAVPAKRRNMFLSQNKRKAREMTSPIKNNGHSAQSDKNHTTNVGATKLVSEVRELETASLALSNNSRKRSKSSSPSPTTIRTGDVSNNTLTCNTVLDGDTGNTSASTGGGTMSECCNNNIIVASSIANGDVTQQSNIDEETILASNDCSNTQDNHIRKPKFKHILLCSQDSTVKSDNSTSKKRHLKSKANCGSDMLISFKSSMSDGQEISKKSSVPVRTISKDYAINSIEKQRSSGELSTNKSNNNTCHLDQVSCLETAANDDIQTISLPRSLPSNASNEGWGRETQFLANKGGNTLPSFSSFHGFSRRKLHFPRNSSFVTETPRRSFVNTENTVAAASDVAHEKTVREDMNVNLVCKRSKKSLSRVCESANDFEAQEAESGCLDSTQKLNAPIWSTTAALTSNNTAMKEDNENATSVIGNEVVNRTHMQVNNAKEKNITTLFPSDICKNQTILEDTASTAITDDKIECWVASSNEYFFRPTPPPLVIAKTNCNEQGRALSHLRGGSVSGHSDLALLRKDAAEIQKNMKDGNQKNGTNIRIELSAEANDLQHMEECKQALNTEKRSFDMSTKVNTGMKLNVGETSMPLQPDLFNDDHYCTAVRLFNSATTEIECDRNSNMAMRAHTDGKLLPSFSATSASSDDDMTLFDKVSDVSASICHALEQTSKRGRKDTIELDYSPGQKNRRGMKRVKIVS